MTMMTPTLIGILTIAMMTMIADQDQDDQEQERELASEMTLVDPTTNQNRRLMPTNSGAIPHQTHCLYKSNQRHRTN